MAPTTRRALLGVAALAAVPGAAAAAPAPHDPDAELIALGRREPELQAAYEALEAEHDELWDAWTDTLPKVPAVLHVLTSDLNLPCCDSRYIGGVWSRELCDKLAVELPRIRQRSGQFPATLLERQVERAEEILAARAAHDAARENPASRAARAAFEQAQGRLAAASKAYATVADGIRSTPARTLAGLAVKARLHARHYVEWSGEPETDALTRTFLADVIATCERAGSEQVQA